MEEKNKRKINMFSAQSVLILGLVCVCLFNHEASAQSSQLSGGNVACGQERVRRDWNDYSTAEKNLYKQALASSMSSGLYKRFVDVHMERTSEYVAHRTCAFMLWHRRYLLAFENMLRSQHSTFRCLTVPYWNSPQEYQRMLDGECNNMEDCSSLVRQLGGLKTSKRVRATINGKAAEGYCYSGFQSYCSDDGICDCIPRTNLTEFKVPAGSGYSSIFNMISAHTSYATFARRVQEGVHNEIHSVVGGFMSTFASPADPLFWSWHAFVDLLFSTFHKCHIEDPMSEQERKTSAFAFNQQGETCAYSGNAEFKAESTIIMRTKTDFAVENDPTIGKFFTNVGNQFWNYADSRVLEDYSYDYKLSEEFTDRLLNNHNLCPTANKTVNGTAETKDSKYWQWYEKALKGLQTIFPDNEKEVARQMEYLECLGYENLFGVKEFSQEFLHEMKLRKDLEPRCQKLVEDVKSGVVETAIQDGGDFDSDKVRIKDGSNVSSRRSTQYGTVFTLIITLAAMRKI